MINASYLRDGTLAAVGEFLLMADTGFPVVLLEPDFDP